MMNKEIVSAIQELIEWGNTEEHNNNVFRKSSYDLNEDWIEKMIQLKAKVEDEN